MNQELAQWEAICKRSVNVLCEGRHYIGVNDADVAEVSAMLTRLPATSPVPPDIKISRHGVAVDQNYRWNHDMSTCPGGKVQLLGLGGLPCYGHKTDPGIWKAWAALPKA